MLKVSRFIPARCSGKLARKFPDSMFFGERGLRFLFKGNYPAAARLNNLGLAYLMSGNYTEAKNILYNATLEFPNELPVLWFNLGLAQLMERELSTARNSFEIATDLDKGILALKEYRRATSKLEDAIKGIEIPPISTWYKVRPYP
ncbi:hypothetical protein A2276_00865 [candidate division WOR-1 bacterium RIFOXYA12_FULL_43_27]|uniref:Uncharacterized protein n=1 Tax=candidate division WOR-1 bacterium RIFOXYC2_FULL_46_14 TaxID=1802587 RepID=A0A1F4U4W1_UNCSA|nr:MAG: hypothetical protein A2276_00865 [candidate division WOR-1 bacterium RIFOXYA12_FULL_43_27]OGC20763.1 MAG: hypothetical protein A2292_07010 [candidate division WOR-1 bacterium RIFOXYB2_FULL_46_45]OGC31500.1 MAG: hypothetical protein A2232_04440 [candidate division WOR-1 bacterium RIFOXYA2_FULL_46_56]OGC39907.1 MAG: hypothetical protein A2438_05280 [candidate division WOR-1 bacterium RIFOXYC2_FULL_46_14]